MPGFGTSTRTRSLALRLAEDVGRLGAGDRHPRRRAERHLEDIGLSTRDRSVAFENAQARERTQILMDLANKESGLVVGTGDLSELALGFATFGGDHLSMYNVNASVPKTLVRFLVTAAAADPLHSAESEALLKVLALPISPELLPPGSRGEIAQKTEDILGPYELHDFYLYCFPAPRIVSREDALPGRRGLRREVHSEATEKVAAGLPGEVLCRAIQEIHLARRPQSRFGEPLPARRFPDAIGFEAGRLVGRTGLAVRIPSSSLFSIWPSFSSARTASLDKDLQGTVLTRSGVQREMVRSVAEVQTRLAAGGVSLLCLHRTGSRGSKP